MALHTTSATKTTSKASMIEKLFLITSNECGERMAIHVDFFFHTHLKNSWDSLNRRNRQYISFITKQSLLYFSYARNSGGINCSPMSFVLFYFIFKPWSLSSPGALFTNFVKQNQLFTKALNRLCLAFYFFKSFRIKKQNKYYLLVGVKWFFSFLTYLFHFKYLIFFPFSFI